MSRRPSPCEVDRVFQIGGRHELGMPHRARPAAQHVLGIGVARLKDLQGGDQLVLEHLSAAAVIGQRRQRRDDLHPAAVGAEVRFHPPDRQHDLARDAVLRLDPGQDGRQLRQLLAAGGDAHVRHGAVQVQPDGAREFGLAAVQADHLGVVAGQRHGAVIGRARHARRQGAGAELLDEPLQAGLVAGIGGGDRGHGHIGGRAGAARGGHARHRRCTGGQRADQGGGQKNAGKAHYGSPVLDCRGFLARILMARIWSSACSLDEPLPLG